jgi:hypothetical protein
MRGECTDPDDAYIYIEQLWPATTHTQHCKDQWKSNLKTLNQSFLQAVNKMKSSTLIVILVLQAVLVMGIFAAVAKENGASVSSLIT